MELKNSIQERYKKDNSYNLNNKNTNPQTQTKLSLRSEKSKMYTSTMNTIYILKNGRNLTNINNIII
jgi:hypothetical protein